MIAIGKPARLRRRRAFTMVEVATTALLLAIAMSTTLHVLGWVAAERRRLDRREWAVQEVSNLMERLAARRWDDLNASAGKTSTLSATTREMLPGAELSVAVDAMNASESKRIAILLRWRTVREPGMLAVLYRLEVPPEGGTMRHRRGYALIEMVLVMTTLVVIFALCVGLIHALLRLDRACRAHLNKAATRDRLARQFRQDARASGQSTPDAKVAAFSDHLEMVRLDGRVVRYQTRANDLVRTERRGDQTIREESYRFPARGPIRFRVHDDGALVSHP